MVRYYYIEERPENCEHWIENYLRDCWHIDAESPEKWIEKWRQWREDRLRDNN